MRDEAGGKGGWDTELQVITRVEEKALWTAFSLLTEGLTKPALSALSWPSAPYSSHTQILP